MILLAGLLAAIPAAHVDAFIKSCRAGDVAAATCRCMVDRYSQSAAGAAFVDFTGMAEIVTDEEAKTKAFVEILDRHGLKASDFLAYLEANGKTVEAVARACG